MQRFLIFLSLFAVLLGRGAFVNADICRDLLAEVNTDIVQVSVKTISDIEDIRFLEMYKMVELSVQKLLAEDAFLGKALNEGERTDLTLAILSGFNSRKRVVEIMREFLVEKKNKEVSQAKVSDALSHTSTLLAKLPLTITFNFKPGVDAFKVVQQAAADLTYAGFTPADFEAMVYATTPTHPSVKLKLTNPSQYSDFTKYVLFEAEREKPYLNSYKVVSLREVAEHQSTVHEATRSYLDKVWWIHLDPNTRSETVAFLETMVFPDPHFFTNPAGYLVRWQKNHDDHHELKAPEDPARSFLEDLQKKGQLSEFAQEVKLAEFKRAQKVPLLSESWNHLTD